MSQSKGLGKIVKKKYVVFPLLMVLTSSLLVGCVEEYKTTTVEATVIEKEYDPPETSYKTVKKSDGTTTKKKVVKPEEYEVTIQYQDIEREFEDEELYDQVEEGQKIQVEYKEGLDKEGKVITRSIHLVDNE